MKLAINTTFINKPETKEDYKNICGTFDNVEVSSEELSKIVHAGYAFCPQINNNWKKASNFLCSDYLAVDIDEGIPIENMMEHDFVKQYCSFIYTTVNHTEEDHRFRIVFELEETITDPNIMKHAMSGLLKKFGGDPSCKDPTRMFFGSKGCKLHQLNNTLPEKQVKLLIPHGEESNKPSQFQDTKTSEFKSSFVSNNIIDLDTTVVDRDGNNHILRELPPQTPIRCPVHSPDDKASAFTLINKVGTVGVHCMKCSTTYYTSSGTPPFDFNYSLSNLKHLENLPPDYLVDPDDILEIEQLLPKSVIRAGERYLKQYNTNGDFVFVKSPKGTGKTYWLEQVVNQCKKDNRNRIDWLDSEPERRPMTLSEIRKWARWKGVLLIGHRRSLISSLSERLGLKSYLNSPYYDHTKNIAVKESFNKPVPYYSICADSLSTLIDTRDNWWPIIIIDEVEQVLSHLTSDTLKTKRNNTYHVFKHLINSAKKVYLMDADLNELTVETMHQLLIDKNKSVSVIINDYKVNNKSFDLYARENHLKKDLLDTIANDKRCFICSNSKRKIDVLTELIKQKFKGTKKIISITVDNSQHQEIQDFIRNIKTEILKYDVILCSPTLSTGIDISFNDDKQHIDCVYGLFETRVNTHFDIDQQISRVRNPKHIRVWISPQTFRFQTNKEVIRKEIEESHEKYRQIVSINDDGEKQYNDNEYLNLYSHVKSIERGSKNNLKNNFIKLKKYNGWSINDITANDIDLEEIKELNKLSKEEKLIEKILNLTSAKLITKQEYSTLLYVDNNYNLTNEQISSMRRYEIEVFYLQEIDEELIKLDNDGNLRNQIREFTLLNTSYSDIKVLEQQEEKQSVFYTDRESLTQKKDVYIAILKRSGLLDDGHNLILDKYIHSSDMTKFITYIKKNELPLQRLFNSDIRKDIETKPIQQLNVYLRRLGIKTKRKTKKTPDGGKDYFYTIDPDRLKIIEDIITTRSDKTTSELWHTNREATKENRLFEHSDYDGNNDVYGDAVDQINNQYHTDSE